MKEYKLEWSEYVDYAVIIKAETPEKAKEIWSKGEEGEVMDCEFIEDSLEITELD